MTRNVSMQTYLPKHVAAWVQEEATHAKLSRSQWIGAIVTYLFQGQELRQEARQNAEFIKRRSVFIMCALDGLLLAHSDATLRTKVHQAHKRQLDKLAQEKAE